MYVAESCLDQQVLHLISAVVAQTQVVMTLLGYNAYYASIFTGKDIGRAKSVARQCSQILKCLIVDVYYRHLPENAINAPPQTIEQCLLSQDICIRTPPGASELRILLALTPATDKPCISAFVLALVKAIQQVSRCIAVDAARHLRLLAH